MAKLWQKKVQQDKVMERFTVGDDYLIDMHLVEADVLGSIAHAKMLSEVGILTVEEFGRLQKALVGVPGLLEAGKFGITVEQEDVHTALEEHLVAQVGEVGKKIHTARSRNDQAAVAVRLYGRARVLEVSRLVLKLTRTCLDFAAQYKDVPMVGRTHTQRAMPSSVGLWASAFAEAMLEDLELLLQAYEQLNRSPLGSAASYGVALPIKRERTAELLGMEPIVNVLYANNTRGKVEATVLFALAQVMNDLSKLSSDTILFALPEFGYFTLPEKYCGGSSSLPQKKNPAQLELTRAKTAAVQGQLFIILGITRGLYSGYNRDFQETKRPLIEGFNTTADALEVVEMVFSNLTVNEQTCRDAFTPEVFAADAANELVGQGMPFRDAYRKIGLDLDALAERDPVENIRSKKHLGATGNLGLDLLGKRLADLTDRVDIRSEHVRRIRETLLGL